MIAPCKDCVDRKAGCHSECSRYSQYKDYMNELHKKQGRENALRASFRERSYTKYMKAKKRSFPRKKEEY